MSESYEADFIAGPMDGKKFALEKGFPEYRFSVLREPVRAHYFRDDELPEKVEIDILVYRHIGHGAYLFYTVEHK